MASLPHDCPYCGTRHASFSVISEHRPNSLKTVIQAFVCCGVCGKFAVATFHPTGKNVADHSATLNAHYQAHPGAFEEIDFCPSPEMPEAPDYLPDNVRSFYLEAVQNVKTGPNAAGAMFRKSLDVALRHIAPEAKGNLIKRITKAAEDRILTPDLADWAHHIRVEGNDAAHDEDPFTPDEAADLHKFVELVLMYMFTLPGMLAARRPAEPEEAEK